jgi:hypothetical protein
MIRVRWARGHNVVVAPTDRDKLERSAAGSKPSRVGVTRRVRALEPMAMEHAEAMTDTPPTVDDDLVNELRTHLDRVPLIELAALVCVERALRINSALGQTPQLTHRCNDLPGDGAGSDGRGRRFSP